LEHRNGEALALKNGAEERGDGGREEEKITASYDEGGPKNCEG
jgi:hypothetical protein